MNPKVRTAELEQLGTAEWPHSAGSGGRSRPPAAEARGGAECTQWSPHPFPGFT